MLPLGPPRKWREGPAVQYRIRPSLGEIVGEEGGCRACERQARWRTVDCGDALWFWLDGVRQGECKEQVWAPRQRLDGLLIRDAQVINALDEKQGSWWECRDARCEPFSC
jgi:hypothetical protein